MTTPIAVPAYAKPPSVGSFALDRGRLHPSWNFHWPRAGPKSVPETHCTLRCSGQSPEQRLIAVDTSFTHQKDLAVSGAVNCPLAVDHADARVYVSADCLTSICLRSGDLRRHKTNTDSSVLWMLEYRPDGPDLLMLLHGPDPKSQCLGVLDLQTGDLQERPLPPEAFVPLAVDHERGVALFSTRRAGAALCDLSGSAQPLASIFLPPFVAGGCFDHEGGQSHPWWQWIDGLEYPDRGCQHPLYDRPIPRA